VPPTAGAILKLFELFRVIEGHEFAVRLGIASRREQLVALLQQEPAYEELLAAVKSNDETARTVLHRIATLSATEFDRDYQNPFDVALVAYLWAFFETKDHYPLYLPLGLDFASQAQDTWWVLRAIGAIQDSIPENKTSPTAVTYEVRGFKAQHVVGLVKARVRYRAAMIAVPGSTNGLLSKNTHTPASFEGRISKSNSAGTQMVV
jgi:hypothetical protein